MKSKTVEQMSRELGDARRARHAIEKELAIASESNSPKVGDIAQKLIVATILENEAAQSLSEARALPAQADQPTEERFSPKFAKGM